MIVYLEDLARIAEIEFSNIVDGTEMVETKLRIKANEGVIINSCQFAVNCFQTKDAGISE